MSPADNYTITGTCNMGDNFFDSVLNQLYVCISPTNRTTIFEAIDMNGIYCDATCPTPNLFCVRDPTIVYTWSTASIWQNVAAHKLPSAKAYSLGVPSTGDDVFIECPWTIVIDQNITVGTLIIDGYVSVDCTKQITINAINIWVRGGEFHIGTPSSPCTNKVTINFIGTP